MRIFQIRAAWHGLVGAVAAGRSHPTSLDRGRLLVGVADSSWLQELTYLKAPILEKIQALVGAEAVTELRFHVRPGARTLPPSALGRGTAELPDPEEELRRRPLAPAVADALTRFEEDLERVQNPELRRSIRRAYIRHLLRQG